MKVLSLFDGISCGQVALERVGKKVETYFASEISEHSINVTQKHFPNTIQLGNVSGINTDNLPIIDLLIGGSPCQGFSFAGKQLNFDDPRSKLFFEFVRIFKNLSIKNTNLKFIFENVKMKREYQDVISEHLGVLPIEINSSLVSAQKRKRLYWTNIEVCQPDDLGILLSDIKETSSDASLYLNNSQIARGHLKHASQVYKTGNKMGKVSFPTSTPKAKTLTKVNIIGSRETNHVQDILGIRLLTTTERLKLQTLPINYLDGVKRNKAWEMLGDCWTVDVICHILKGL